MNQENFNIPEQPDTPPQITKEHHAGQQGVPPDVREVPVREFKETTLTEAMDQGRLGLIKDPTLTDEDEPSYLGVPIDTSTLNLTAEEIEEIEARRDKAERGNSFMNFLKKPVGKAVAILAGLAIVGSAVGVGVKVGAGSEQTNTPPAPDDKVTSGPEVPGVVPPVVVETVPAPTPEVTTPAPEQTPAQPESGPSTGKAAEFDMSDAEYQAIVDDFKLNMSEYPTPESAMSAFNLAMTMYFNGGHNKTDHEKHYEWSFQDFHPGWNSWSTEVYTSAIEEAVFTENYINTDNNYIQSMRDLKDEANRMWANTNRANPPDYEMAFNFVPEGKVNLYETGWIDATGSLTYTDNAADNVETATDSHAIGSYTFSNAKITMKPNKETGTWQVTQIISTNQ